ncbi:hypothetical protein SAMN04490179_1822 [Pseudomonas antarctica]|uniref:Uncharacterized protein n=1 Tax=Pseudomonas antarctica TaxID=219572 RepID=A0A1G9XJQ3_9PSED|nr:hypothetical protein PSAN_24280 [Pseudomonas antarctica]SDM96503.1 hypothetical protein SAMN04490179_1822 [Pseudomonas antarctica]
MLTFNTLWKNHSEIFGDAAPCRTNGAKNFSDQRATRPDGYQLAHFQITLVTNSWFPALPTFGYRPNRRFQPSDRT